jgi:hypothetical protein
MLCRSVQRQSAAVSGNKTSANKLQRQSAALFCRKLALCYGSHDVCSGSSVFICGNSMLVCGTHKL